MPAEWYYTSNQQQMGPVTWEELQQLAERGLLKPQDLVWTDGMADWVKAAKQTGLFTESTPVAVPRKRSRADAEETRPRRARRRYDDDDDDDDEDEQDVRAARRRKARRKEGMALGLKIGLAIGGGVFLLMFLICGGIFLFTGSADTGQGPVSYSCSLDLGHTNERSVFFKAGRAVRITVTATSAEPRTDVDLHVYAPGVDANPRAAARPLPLAADESIGLNSVVQFVPPLDGNYTVQVRNVVQNPNPADRRGRGRASCQVTIAR